MQKDNSWGVFALVVAGLVVVGMAGGERKPNVPMPTPGKGLQAVLGLYESEDLPTMPRSYVEQLFGTKADGVRKYLSTHAPAGSVLMLDRDNAKLSNVPSMFKAAYDREHTKTMPRIIFSDGQRSTSMQLRATPAATIAELQKLGGP